MSRTVKEKRPVVSVKTSMDIADPLKYKIASDKKVNFSKQRAFGYLELDTFQGERPVNEHHVQHLYNEWTGGRFMWDHVIIGICECGGKKYRINGQHCCWMRVNLDEQYFVKKGEEPQVREIVYLVDTEDQMRTLYSTFDRNKSRSAGHVFKSLMAGTNYASDLWPSTLNVIGAGLRLWQFEEKDKWLISANDVAALASDKHNDLFKIVGLFFQSHYGESLWMKRAAVVAAMFATFDAQGGKAPDFWEPVLSGLNLTEKSDPRYALRTFLETHKQSTSRKGAVAGITSAEDTYRVCISAWNKWRSGQKVLAGLRTTETRQKAK